MSEHRKFIYEYQDLLAGLQYLAEDLERKGEPWRHENLADSDHYRVFAAIAELRERDAVLSALGVCKEADGTWTMPCEGLDLYFTCSGGDEMRDPDYPTKTGQKCTVCKGTGRIPVPPRRAAAILRALADKIEGGKP